MFIDDCLDSLSKRLKPITHYIDYDFETKLRNAQKFVLEKAVSETVESMYITDDSIYSISSKYESEVKKLENNFRCPYPLMWIELYPSNTRTGSPNLHEITRLGFLIESESNGRLGLVSMFYAGKPGVSIALAQMVFSMDRELPLTIRLDYGVEGLKYKPNPNFGIDSSRFERLLNISSDANSIFQGAKIDWIGEWNTLFWSIIMLNSKTGFSKRVVNPDTALQKARRLRGKSPLQSYNIVLLDKKYHSNIEGESSPTQKRLHWVRGHFKQRTTGVFWWSAHLAGNKKLGFVDKHYVKQGV